MKSIFLGFDTTPVGHLRIRMCDCTSKLHPFTFLEYKHKLEPVKQGGEPVHFGSLDQVKEELLRLGFDKAYLRLHNTYDEFGSEPSQRYCDIELALNPH